MDNLEVAEKAAETLAAAAGALAVAVPATAVVAGPLALLASLADKVLEAFRRGDEATAQAVGAALEKAEAACSNALGDLTAKLGANDAAADEALRKRFESDSTVPRTSTMGGVVIAKFDNTDEDK